MTPQSSKQPDDRISNSCSWGLLAVILTVIGAVIYALFFSPLSTPITENLRERVRMGIAMQPTDILMFVASENGYFGELGLEVVVKKYPSGKRALHDGLFTGQIDIASASDVPVAMAGLNSNDFKIITTAFSADNVNRIIARKDRGINKPEDLKGKILATQRASAVHFFLHLFLHENGMNEQDETIQFMKAEFLVDALAQGDIDAFSMREPYISQAQKLLGDNAIVFSKPGLYSQKELLVGASNFVSKHPSVIQKVLKGLARASSFIQDNPAEAIDIASRWLGVKNAEIAKIWPTVRFNMGLSQELVSLLENEACWAIQNEVSMVRNVPNYLDFIDATALQKISPNPVTILKKHQAKPCTTQEQ